MAFAVISKSALVALALGALSGCAGMGPVLSKEELETTLNAELMTGAGPDQIQAFFERHEFPYSYDPMLRRYRSTLDGGSNHKLDIYIYTDTERKLTIAQIIGTETPRGRPTTSLPRDLNTSRDGRF